LNLSLIITALIILLPSSYQLPQAALPLGNFYINLVELLILGLILIWLLNVLFLGSERRGKSAFAGAVISLLLLYAVYIAWGLLERDAIMVLGDFRQYLPLLLYFPLRRALHNEQAMEKMRKALFIALFIIAAYIIIIFIFLKPQLLAYAAKASTDFSGERIFIDNGIFIFLAYLGCITAAIFSASTPFLRKLVLSLLLLVNILALIILQVRNFWIMAALIFVLSFFTMQGALNKIKYVLTGACSVMFLVGMVFLMMQAFDYQSKTIDNIKDRFASLAQLDTIGKNSSGKNESVGSIETRMATAEYALKKYIIPNWFFGLGFGSQTPMVNKLGAVGLMKYQIDNGYLTLLLKFGVFGLLFYGFLSLKIITELMGIIFNPEAREMDTWLAKSFLYAIIAMAAGSFFSSIFIREQVCIVSFVIMLCEIELIRQRLRAPKAA